MRLKMAAALEPGRITPAHDPLARPIRPEDASELAALMLQAYRGTIDDAGETPDEARAEVDRLLSGGYGAFDAAASEVVERGGELVSATMVTRYEHCPLIAFSITAPSWKRQGLARAGLLRAMSRLAERGEPTVQLVVTKGNDAAEALYLSLGFVAVT